MTDLSSSNGRPDDPEPMMVAIGHFLFTTRDLVFPLVFIPLAVAIPPLVVRGDWLDAALDTIGVGIALSGQVLRSLVIGFVYILAGDETGRSIQTRSSATECSRTAGTLSTSAIS